MRFEFELVTKWFGGKFIVVNASKYHFMCLGMDGENNETFHCNIIV